MNTPTEFYDNFATKLTRDFIGGNARTESAILFASNTLQKEDVISVLDLGCGIGWSTYEMARACPDGLCCGVDLSPSLIAVAKRMFAGNKACQFMCGDLTVEEWAANIQSRYNACVMLDVYEHIPKAARSDFHEALSSVLSDDALLILTCPTTLHQEFLRNTHPEGLQPVDEDVGLVDLQQLGEQVSAEITHFEYKSIWATNDYFHAVLKRNPARIEGVDPLPKHQSLLSKSARMKHVQMAAELLGAEAMRELKAINPSFLERIANRLRRVRLAF